MQEPGGGPDGEQGWARPHLCALIKKNLLFFKSARIKTVFISYKDGTKHLKKKIFFGGFFVFFSYYIQHCFICRPSESTVPTDAGMLVHWQSDAVTTRLDQLNMLFITFRMFIEKPKYF